MKMNKTIMLTTMLTLFVYSLPIKTEVLHPTGDSVEQFKEQISDGIVVIDFFAKWCGPCKRFAPIFSKTSSDFSNIKFIKVDIDQYRSFAKEYGVRSMPTIMIFKDGKKVIVKTGAMSYSVFKKWINEWTKK